MGNSIWDKLKRALQLSESTEVDVESRRRFLKGAAGLAVMAVIPIGIDQGYRLLTTNEQKQFITNVKSGQVVENMTFYLDRTVVLKDLKGVVIRNCRFVATPDFVGDSMIEFRNSDNFIINSCIFDANAVTGGLKSAMHFKDKPEINATIHYIG